MNRRPTIGELSHKLTQFFKRKTCLHPNASKEVCDSKIINAHTISRSSTLKEIVNKENKVLTFYPISYDGNKPKPHKRGWKKATTFLGYCSTHDSETFRHIEQNEFKPDPKSCFLIGYRALCHEFYMKLSSYSASAFQEDLTKDISDPIEKYFKDYHIEVFNREVKEGFDIVQKTKEIYDKSLLADNFEDFNYLVISFQGKLSAVSTGMITPIYLPSGSILQDYHAKFLQNLFFGIATNNNKHFIIIHWPKEFNLINKYVMSILDLKGESLPSFLVQKMFYFVENTYFSEVWWRKLDSKTKDYLTSLAYEPFAYNKPLNFKNLKIVDWNNIQIVKRIDNA
jgi:hypothetical protein